jgi:hypothetical protein
MSEERELLKKILATGWLNNTISCEVEELLAQPEVEPLSYCAIRAIVNQLPTEVDLDTGIEFCRIIEKAHGIGGDDE